MPNVGFETQGGGRGVYTSTVWHKAMAYSVPMLPSKQHKGLVNMVMMVRILGDLSPDGVGVLFPATATTPWQAGPKAKAYWGYDTCHCQSIPKWIVVDRHVFSEDLVKINELGITRERTSAMLATLLAREVFAKQCRGICDGVH